MFLYPTFFFFFL